MEGLSDYFSLSPSFDKLKLVGHQTDPLPGPRYS